MSKGSHIVALKAKHAKIDDKLKVLQRSQVVDGLEVTALKKQKLHLKDRISQLEDSRAL